jgi:hypothetical protein
MEIHSLGFIKQQIRKINHYNLVAIRPTDTYYLRIKSVLLIILLKLKNLLCCNARMHAVYKKTMPFQIYLL